MLSLQGWPITVHSCRLHAASSCSILTPAPQPLIYLFISGNKERSWKIEMHVLLPDFPPVIWPKLLRALPHPQALGKFCKTLRN